MRGYWELLRRSPAYTRLWLAYAISLLGDWFNTIVLTTLITVYSPPESKGMALSGLLLARFLPPLLAGPFAGVLVDRVDRRWVLILSDLLRGIVVIFFIFVDSPERLWLVYVLSAFQFVLSSLFEPARSAFLPVVVARDDLIIANTLSSITWSVMLAVGAAMGGLVAGLVGTTVALIVNAAAYLISALFIWQIKVKPTDEPIVTAEDAPPVAERTFIDGLRYVAANPPVAMAALVKMGANIGAVDLSMVIYATEYFPVGRDGTISTGILWSFFGIGSVIGPLLTNYFNDDSVRSMRRLTIIGFIWIVLGWLGFSAAGTLFIAGLMLGVRAMGSSVAWTYSSVILQETVPDEYLGRVFSLDQTGFRLATVLSTLIVGDMIDTLGIPNVRTLVLAIGIVSIIPTVLWTAVVLWLDRRDGRLALLGN